jgi:hypothetical protein
MLTMFIDAHCFYRCPLCLDMPTVSIYGHCVYICSLCLHMLTVLYAYCFICSLCLHMLTVFIYAHYVLLQWQEEKGMRADSYKDDNLLELVGDLCSFIMDQIVHVRGIYHDRLSYLGRNSQYQYLREWERLGLGR